MNVLVTDKIDMAAIDKMKSAGLSVDAKFGIAPEELVKIIGNYNVLVVRSATKVTKDVIDSGKNLKLVVRGGVGMDNIDAAAAKAANIKVENTPEASSVSVAELAIGMMLSLIRKIAIADSTMKQGKWEKKTLEGVELYKKTLGLIGIGRIGYEVAKRAVAFGMDIVAYDPYLKPVPDYITKLGVKMLSLDEVLKNSDYISLHLPMTPESKNMLNAGAFAKMKQGVRIVNCARGGIINENDLAEAIKSGKVGGAAIDVYEKEPAAPDNPLRGLGDKVVLTPHLGASSSEGQARVGDAVADKLIAYAKK
ncbi:MAG: hydroxyacid dehydrogenase [Candidatus Brocadiia bacterium]